MKTLQKFLTINYLFSTASGLAMLLLTTMLNRLFGISNTYVFPLIGVNLLFFAAFVFYVAKWQLNNKALVYTVSLLDGCWVLGSLLILLLDPFGLTVPGNTLIGAVAVWIGFLGYMQYRSFEK